MEVYSTPSSSAPPSPSSCTSTDPMVPFKTESPYDSNCGETTPATAPRYLSGWRAYLMIGAISGSTFLNVRRYLGANLHVSILNSRSGVLQRRDDSRHSLHWERFTIYSGRLGMASASIQVCPSYRLITPTTDRECSLTYGCLLLLTGRLADKYGRRTVFLIGAALFSLLSIPPIFTTGATGHFLIAQFTNQWIT